MCFRVREKNEIHIVLIVHYVFTLYTHIMIAYVLTFSLLLVASLQGILIPMLAENYDSGYFVCAMCASQFSLFLLLAYCFYVYKRRKLFTEDDETLDISIHSAYRSSHVRIFIDEDKIAYIGTPEDEIAYIISTPVVTFNSCSQGNNGDDSDGCDGGYDGDDDGNSSNCDDGNSSNGNDSNLIVLLKQNVKYVMITSGIFMGLSSLFMIYSSNPVRTPIVLQLILNGLNIVPSFLLTKYYLKKKVEYNKTYCCWSIITLLLSIGIAIIPIDDIGLDYIVWPIIFLLSQIFRVTGYILQEKYFMVTTDRSTRSKLYNMTYCRFVQFVATLLFFWLDIVMGYESTFDPLVEDFKAVKNAGTDFILLELFVFTTIIFCIVSGYLNSISMKYSTIALTLVTPIVGAFFSIFPQLNNGKQYPLYITLPSLALNLLSSILWMKGEMH
jgi:hypothetical protein